MMPKLKRNVLEFNTHTEMLVLSLQINRAEAPNLLHQLFPAYLSCSDKKHTEYMGNKQNKFGEGGKDKRDITIVTSQVQVQDVGR